MLLTNIFSVAALAATVVADGASITAAMTKIKSDTTQLGNTVSSWHGDIFGVLPIAGESIGLLETIKKGSKTVSKSAALTQTEALGIAGSTVDLATQVNKTLEAIIAAKPKFDDLIVVSPIILFNLEEQKKATADFSSKILTKVPAELQAIAKSLIQPINDGFSKAIDIYQIRL